MLWQDWVISIGGVIFAIALIPSVIGQDKPALSTSLMTGTVMITFAVTYFTLSLWFSSVTIFIGGSLWLVLAVQKYRQSRAANRT